MIQRVKVGDATAILDTGKIYSGKDGVNDKEKLVRKAMGLPVTKQLVYYSDRRDAKSAEDIIQYRLDAMYDIACRWYTVEITTETGLVTKINSMYLAHMQKPDFVADIAKQDEKMARMTGFQETRHRRDFGY